MTTRSDSNAIDYASQGGYAVVDNLKMYYEIHGAGRPLLLLHGGLMTIDTLGPILPALARTRQVIAVELEGHGHTADLERPLRYAQMAEDVANLLGQLGRRPVDILGYSLGGTVSLHLALRHPALVRKLVVASAPYSQDGFYPGVIAAWANLSAERFAGTLVAEAYARSAPEPRHFPIFVEKMKQALINFEDLARADIQSLTALTLLVLGDADIVLPEYALEMFRLLGGGATRAQLAVLPGTKHLDLIGRVDLLLPILLPFLDAPVPGAS